MRKLAFCVALLIGSCTTQTPPTDSTVAALPDISTIERPDDPAAASMVEDFLLRMDKRMALVEAIGRLEARDQYARDVFIGMFRDPDLDANVRIAFQQTGSKYLDQIDDLNTQELKQLLEDVSWRDLAEWEGDLFKKAFLIVQHTGDLPYQAAVLDEVKPLAKEGLVEGQLFAVMFDRVQLDKDETQLYGTQTKCIDGQYDVYGLTDPDTVDNRRAALDMEPIADYLRVNREYYGPCG